MSDGLLVLFNGIAILIMVFCLYFPRHGRKDMIVALFGINVGVLGVSFTLADAAVSAGLGLGLFGVLSIIRLRSNELGQQEIAYYFCALALGLIGGVNVDSWISPALMGAILAILFIGDHPQLFSEVGTKSCGSIPHTPMKPCFGQILKQCWAERSDDYKFKELIL